MEEFFGNSREHLRSLIGRSGALSRGRISCFGQGEGPVADFFVLSVGAYDTLVFRSFCPVHQDGDWEAATRLICIEGCYVREFPGLSIEIVKKFSVLDRIQMVFAMEDVQQEYPAGVLRITLDGESMYLIMDEAFSMTFFSSPDDIKIRDDVYFRTGRCFIDV